MATGKRVVVAAVGGPYDIAYFTGAPAYAAEGSQPPTLHALAGTLFGARPTGRLPVTIPVAGHPGRPLYRYGTGPHY